MSDTTHVRRFCHLFFDETDEYLFIKELNHGSHSRAQLVLHLQTGERRVRKVSIYHLNEEEKKIEDREKVLFHLQEQAAKLGTHPHIVHLYSANDVPAAPKAGKKRWARVVYMKYYDGGDVFKLYKAHEASGRAMSSSMLFRILWHVFSGLESMYTSCVLHADLYDSNILAHRDPALGGRLAFFLADFGSAELGALTDPSNRFTDDVEGLSLQLRKWLDCGPEPHGERDPLWKYLDAVVYPALVDACSEGDSLPDPRPLIEVLEKAPAGPPEPPPIGDGPEPEDMRVPLFHDTEQDARYASGVAGPWHLAEVSVDRSTGRATIVGFSPETYDNAPRPFGSVYSGTNLLDSESEADLTAVEEMV